VSGDIDWRGRRAADPASGGLVKFTDGDGLHVTHCDTLSGYWKRPRILTWP
jgi:hypothetical protein